MLRPGDMVGDFVLEELIGSGGMGSVYRALQPIIERRVAIKVLKQAWSGREDAVARFVREARAIHRIKPRGVPDVLTYGTLPDGTHYYVMELLEGEDLRTRLRSAGRLGPPEVVRIVSSIASILDAAHAEGIIHRDLKPENVFLCASDEVKLLDFGIAKLAPDAPPDGLITANVLGTPQYMSPEQYRGKPVDARTDIYSLGVVACEMLGGKLPPGFDRPLDAAMSADPDKRQATASQLASELEAALHRSPIEDVWIGRKVVGIAALSLLVLTGVAWFALRPSETRAQPAESVSVTPVTPVPTKIEPAPTPHQKQPIKRKAKVQDDVIHPDMPVKY